MSSNNYKQKNYKEGNFVIKDKSKIESIIYKDIRENRNPEKIVIYLDINSQKFDIFPKSIISIIK